jgi:CRISPR-associated endonuclease/helicase Cas3
VGTPKKILKSPLIVFNTISSAKTFANKIKKEYCNNSVYLLTSHLTPKDREKILDEIIIKLKSGEKIILVATSIIECGVDFSFDVGFRELCGHASKIQFGGRINRNCENKKPSQIYIFNFDRQFMNNNIGVYTTNTQLNASIAASNGITIAPEYCTEAIKNELQNISDIDTLITLENSKCFKTINNDFSVIKQATITVIIDKEISNKIRNGEKIPQHEISRNSISVRKGSKYVQFIRYFDPNDTWIGEWTGNYDSSFNGISI